MRIRIYLLASWIAGTCANCVPDVGESDTRVGEPRILAVRAEPAEAAPRDELHLRALYAAADGTLEEAPIDWAFCVDRKALAELGPISRACLVEEGDALEPIDTGVAVDTELPSDACRLFGPDRPPAKDDEPTGRPVDPDPTGGFYQPLRLFDSDQGSFGTFDARLACGLPGVTQHTFAEFNRRYHNNENPAIDALEIVSGRHAGKVAPDADEDADAPDIASGQELSLRVRWAECADDDGTCTGSEHYLYYDRQDDAFVERREGMRVSWFASAGTFRDAHTGRSEADAAEASSENVWTAPEKAGDVHVWIVLRDDRGGVGWQSYVVRVK